MNTLIQILQTYIHNGRMPKQVRLVEPSPPVFQIGIALAEGEEVVSFGALSVEEVEATCEEANCWLADRGKRYMSLNGD